MALLDAWTAAEMQVRREDRVTRARANSSPGPYIAELVLDRPSPPPATPEYPLNIPAIAAMTILEAVAYSLRLNPEGGGRNFNFATRESHSSLHRHLRVSRTAALPADLYFLRAESYFNLASEIERLDGGTDGAIAQYYGGGSLHEQSHGESFFSLFSHRFFGPGLYLLDEPEAALSPQRQIALLGIIDRLVRAGSQFLVATHSPILLAFPSATIYLLDESGIRPVPYRESPPFRVTRAFLENPELSLRELLRPDQTA